MPLFNRYLPGDQFISSADLNARAATLEALARSTFGQGYVGPDGFHTRRTAARGAIAATMWIEITGSAQVHEAKYKYAFSEVRLIATAGGSEAEVVTDGWTGTTTTNPAYNIAEINHVAEPADSIAWYVTGVDMHATSILTSTLYPRPVGGGGTSNSHKQDQVVPAWIIDGRVWFDWPMPIDGEC